MKYHNGFALLDVLMACMIAVPTALALLHLFDHQQSSLDQQIKFERAWHLAEQKLVDLTNFATRRGANGFSAISDNRGGSILAGLHQLARAPTQQARLSWQVTNLCVDGTNQWQNQPTNDWQKLCKKEVTVTVIWGNERLQRTGVVNPTPHYLR